MGGRALHRAAEVATVPRVRFGAPWRDTTLPADLPLQYLKTEEEFRKASSPDQKLEMLSDLFRLPPSTRGPRRFGRI